MDCINWFSYNDYWETNPKLTLNALRVLGRYKTPCARIAKAFEPVVYDPSLHSVRTQHDYVVIINGIEHLTNHKMELVSITPPPIGYAKSRALSG